ncbi:MAG: hypothetical protein JNL79_24305 [Myxococcales bacterium]|nr:hypothetical protein [Myxococcales bacterium]
MVQVRAFAAMLAVAVFAPSLASAEAWTPISSRGVLRSAGASARLASGKILITGGQYEPCLSIADLFEPKTLGWSAAASMKEGRGYFCAVALDGGKKVLVVGGTTTQVSGGVATGARSTAEIYDDATNTWTLVKPMSVGRNNHGCALLADGRVLVVAGTGDPTPALSSVEIYDPKTDAWSAAPPLPTALEAARVAPLPGGDVLVAGGGFAFRWSSATSTWIAPAADRAIPKRPRLGRLEDGRVLVIGEGTPLIYDPSARTWTEVGPIKDNQIGATMAALPGDRLLVTGGFTKVVTGAVPLTTVSIFEGKTNKFVEAPPMLLGRVTHVAEPVDPGRVLVVGGRYGSEEIWNALPGVACTTNAQCGSGACVDGFCCDKACGGACEACNVAGKEGTCSAIDGAPRAGHPSCAPYLSCKAGACSGSCASDAECAAGNVCFVTKGRCGPARGLCDGEGSVVAPDGSKKACAPYACGPTGDCLASCATTLDCAAGYACDEKTCVPVVAKATDTAGCHAGFGGASSSAFFALALLLGLRRRRRLAVAAAFAAPLLVTSVAQADGFRPTRPMRVPSRLYSTSTRLADGRVLTAGGTTIAAEASFELYDPTTDLWTSDPKQVLKVARSAHTASLLGDGRVLVVGGQTAKDKPTDSVELFDPTTSTFSLGAKLPIARELHVAVVLADGRVLVAGGVGAGPTNLLEAYRFDPATGTWSDAGKMLRPHGFGGAARLPDGRVLVVGGPAGTKTDLYDPVTNTWSAGPDCTSSHAHATALALTDGRIAVVGASTTAEVYDPTKNAFAPLATGLVLRFDSTATQLPSGEILIVGGSDEGSSTLYETTELLDPVKGLRLGPPLVAQRTGHGAASLADGRVLIVAGLSTNDDTLPFLPSPVVFQLLTGSPCLADAHCGSGFCTDGVCCERRCKEACNTCGAGGTCAPISGKPKADHETCAPYGLCLAGACAAICGNDGYCDDAHVCDTTTATCVEPKAKCEGDEAVDLGTGARKSCAPYRCARGTCGARCANSDDCAAGNACDQGSCVPPGGAGDDGCAVAAPHGSSGAVCLAALFGLGLVRRARLRSRRRRCGRVPTM